MTLDETCISSNNGGVEIVAQQSLDYTATLVGSGVNETENFMTAVSFTDLAAGSYTVCITVAGEPGYEQCFDLIVDEPEDLSVLSKVDAGLKQVTLSLSGGDLYYIELNGEIHATSERQITLELSPAYNELKVTTDKNCQGEYREEIVFSDKILAYPNPVTEGNLTLYMGQTMALDVTISLHSYTGRQLFSGSYPVVNNRVELNLGNINSGSYILSVKTKTAIHNHKIIKR